MIKTVAVILASGLGSRARFERPKQIVKLAGRPVVSHTIERFQKHHKIDSIIVMTNEVCIHEIEQIVSKHSFSKVDRILMGGGERYESTLAAINALDGDDEEQGKTKILLHDAVRPLVSDEIISNVVDALDFYNAVDTAIQASDTVLMADSETNNINDIPDRRLVRLGQTPQGFRLATIKRAYDLALVDAAFHVTDDCGIVLQYLPNEKIHIVEGSPTNLKITFQEDLLILDKLMQANAGKRMSRGGDNRHLSKLDGKRILVFGGTSGIGQAMNRLARAYGAEVCVAARSTGTDIADPDSIVKALSDFSKGDLQIDAVVNTAAILNRKPLSNMTVDEIQESVNVNILGALNVAKLSFEFLEKSKGHLLMFTSSSYTYGRAYYSTYSSSKAAIVNLTQALADEWEEVGVKVSCVSPERTRTPMRSRAFGNEDPSTLLDAESVARRALSIIINESTGLIHDITTQK